MGKTDDALEQMLFLRCQMGDRDAFDRLIERYQEPLYCFIISLLGYSDGTEDVVQNVWISVLRNIHTLRKPEAFSIWLYRIARNIC